MLYIHIYTVEIPVSVFLLSEYPNIRTFYYLYILLSSQCFLVMFTYNILKLQRI